MTIDEMCDFVFDMNIYSPYVSEQVDEVIAFLQARKTDNPPLTIEQLAVMRGLPVWIEDKTHGSTGWHLVSRVDPWEGLAILSPAHQSS